jgi:7-cyano-7-deazaguanine synthase in queuosine biosynthesis
MVMKPCEKSLVCWSGGRDSTLVLYNLLKSREHEIRTISIIHEQIYDSKQMESRQKIKEKLVKEFGDFESINVNISINGSKDGVCIDEGGLFQPVLWISTASGFLKNNENLYLGYIAGDDVWTSIYQIKTLFSNAQEIMNKSGKIIFPLYTNNKSDVIMDLSSTGLLEDTWFCQENGPTPCGKCHSCQTNDMHMYNLKRLGYDVFTNNSEGL